MQERLESPMENLTQKLGILTGYDQYAYEFENLPEEEEILEEHLKGD